MRNASIIFLIFLIHCGAATAEPVPPVQDYIAKLKVRNDPNCERYKSVFNALSKLDSIQYCTVFTQLKEDRASSNARYNIRLKLLEGHMAIAGKKCAEGLGNKEILEDALLMAYQIEDVHLMFYLHQVLAWKYTSENKLGYATMHALSAMDMTEKQGKEHLFMEKVGWYNLGYLFFHSRQYEASINANKKALSPEANPHNPSDTLDLSYKMNTWNTIGLSYEYLQQSDSAFAAFNEAYSIANKLDQPYWKGVIKGNIGDVYFRLNQYDTAAVLLKFDYDQSMATAQYDNAANSLQWLARIQVIKGEPIVALKNAREAMRLLPHNAQSIFMANTLYTLADVFKALGNADSVAYYMKKYISLHDALEKKAYDSHTEIVNMRMQNQASIHTILSLNKEKRNIALLRNFMIALILLTFTIALLILNRQKLKLKIRQQEAIEGKRKAEEEASHALGQLALFTQHLLEKSTLVENLQSQLNQKELDQDQLQYISELTQHAILTEEDWERFKAIFEKVYPGFFFNLRTKAPDITLAEQRIAALIKLQLSVKESALLLGISPNSVYKTRQRLKHRLGLEFDSSLDESFSFEEVA